MRLGDVMAEETAIRDLYRQHGPAVWHAGIDALGDPARATRLVASAFATAAPTGSSATLLNAARAQLGDPAATRRFERAMAAAAVGSGRGGTYERLHRARVTLRDLGLLDG